MYPETVSYRNRPVASGCYPSQLCHVPSLNPLPGPEVVEWRVMEPHTLVHAVVSLQRPFTQNHDARQQVLRHVFGLMCKRAMQGGWHESGGRVQARPGHRRAGQKRSRPRLLHLGLMLHWPCGTVWRNTEEAGPDSFLSPDSGLTCAHNGICCLPDSWPAASSKANFLHQDQQ